MDSSPGFLSRFKNSFRVPDLWRSESMQQIRLIIQFDAARDTVDELGNLGYVQFIDLNPDMNATQRHFVIDVKRFDEMERRIRFFEEQIAKANINTNQSLLQINTEFDKPTKVAFDELEANFENKERELVQMTANQETIDRKYNELIELRHVLDKDSLFLQETEDITEEFQRDPFAEDERSPLFDGAQRVRIANLGYITGVILRDKLQSFERVLWRATRGNLYMKQSEIEEPIKDPHTGENANKNVFMIFFQGERIQAKIKKICESFGANIYNCPRPAQERNDMRQQVSLRLQDLETVLHRSREHNLKTLSDISANLEYWKTLVIKEKSIYHTLNLFNYDLGRKCLIAEGWCPSHALEQIQFALRTATERSRTQVPTILSVISTKETPPTYFKTNKYTEAFQGIVDAYGIANYQEVNPGVLTIVTFPFLFGVMFGDLGHGFILLLFSLFLVWKEDALGRTKLNEIIKICFDGRYIIVLMSLFAMYAGLIYNETFAIGMNLFGSNWYYEGDSEQATWNETGLPYLIGVDPAWKNAENDLIFYNSLKMKLSIILGVTQMVVGILISSLNAIHFKLPYNFFFEFLPQLIFMLALFGYLSILIILKWSIKWRINVGEYPKTPDLLGDNPPPSLLNLMIEMFLSPTSVPQEYHFFYGQEIIQPILLVIAFICVPLMLVPKPMLLKRDHERKQALNAHQRLMDDGPSGEVASEAHQDGHHGGHGGHGHGEFDYGEVFVHQSIHTIEFVLGAISNTASYLRLWALSLAHSELSIVFWEMVMLKGLAATDLGGGQFFGIFIAFSVWAALTFGVLLIMESLSAFLHALRLHWVEFQNKFYKGEGYKFIPFSYKLILEQARENQ
eukprot:TRINITY_DN4931_c0_g1_i1.p1 TRINITY_DN4931_c0_g1~~TRINITY_DN4931_c0_g1_i1.p1  ORF type:complete len:854 (-),score=400.33 TRINITY_DN4931_c0_g1_i1:90-2651(-)